MSLCNVASYWSCLSTLTMHGPINVKKRSKRVCSEFTIPPRVLQFKWWRTVIWEFMLIDIRNKQLICSGLTSPALKPTELRSREDAHFRRTAIILLRSVCLDSVVTSVIYYYYNYYYMNSGTCGLQTLHIMTYLSSSGVRDQSIQWSGLMWA